MDVVYICREGDNEELRYSIRSVVKNLKHDKIWVVGGKPDWYTGNFIEVPQNSIKYLNAKNNMITITKSSEISNNFILMNDDFFIMQPVSQVRYYHAGPLRNKIGYLQKTYGSSPYMSMLNATLRHLRKTLKRMDILDYALHIPFVMNKNKLRPILNLEGMSWRIAYGNMYNVGGKEVVIDEGESRDVKVYTRDNKLFNERIKNTITDKYLSSDDSSFEALQPMLHEKFPDPSPFESAPGQTRTDTE